MSTTDVWRHSSVGHYKEKKCVINNHEFCEMHITAIHNLHTELNSVLLKLKTITFKYRNVNRIYNT
jgi:hypothetical protein